MNEVFFLLEILGVIAFALSGVLVAIKKEMDVFGGCVLGMITATCGGLIRDLILGINPPNVFVNPTPALISIGVSIFAYLPFMQRFFTHKHKVYDLILFITDSVGLGVFTVIGANICFQTLISPNMFTVVSLATITGVGGSVTRDVLSLSIPRIFVKNFYASACILGGVAYYLLFIYWSTLGATIISVLLIFALRICASIFHWELPKPLKLKKEETNKGI